MSNQHPRAAARLVLAAILVASLVPPALAADAGIAQLEHAATLLGDVNDIERLQRIYGYYLDRSDWDNVVDLLTDDATAEYANSGLYVGKASVRKLLYAIGYGKQGIPSGMLREHMQFQPVIDVAPDGKTAQGRWRVFALLGQSGQDARWQAGPYENEYRKEGGKWKISKIRWYETFTVPVESGWKSRLPGSSTNVSDRKMPTPDRPSTSTAGPWPEVSLPPFHYSVADVGKPCCVLSAAASSARAPTAARVARLRYQVQRLEDERDIQVLQRTYGYYVDKNLWSQAADLFADDGTLEIGGRGVFVGKARVLEYLKWLGEPIDGRLYDHTQLQPVVDVAPDGRTAKGRWRALVFGGDLNKSSVFGDVIYENEYRKEGSTWKIATLRAYFIMYTMLDKGGWAKYTFPNTHPEKALPPDRPPTLVYDMYPGVLTAPNHFANPVSGRTHAEAGYSGATTPARAAQVELGSAGAAADDSAALRRRLESLADGVAIENVQNAYGYYVDKWQWDDAARLFTADATLEIGQRGVYVGRDHIRHSFELDGAQGLHQGQVNDRIQYQPVIHVAPDGRTARIRVRQMDVSGKFGQEADLGGGVEENEYAKVDGVWKIRKLHLYTTFLADVVQGWSQGSKPAPGRSDSFPPDRGPSESYRPFPAFFVPAFHYANPVSGRPVFERVAAQAGADAASEHADANSVQELQARVRDLESREEIREVMHDYGRLLDARDFDAFARLWATNSVYDSGGLISKGPQAIAAFLKEIIGRNPAGYKTPNFHVFFNENIDVHGDHATATSKSAFLVPGEGNKADAAIVAEYQDEFTREDGHWKFLRRLVRGDIPAPAQRPATQR